MATPWHQLCTLREDVRKDTLCLDEFTADLNDVRTGQLPRGVHFIIKASSYDIQVT
jgi:hypothetical protein